MWQRFEEKRGNYALCAKLSNCMMEQMSAYFQVGHPKPPWIEGWTELTDLNDSPIWALAKFARASIVVSDNIRHFPPADNGRHVYEGIEYVTARRFFELIEYESIDSHL